MNKKKEIKRLRAADIDKPNLEKQMVANKLNR